MKKPWLSALLNFFFMGLGYIYNGKRILLGAMLTITAVGMTYLEQIHVYAGDAPLQEHDSTAFMIMFACVFIANTALAIDGYREAGEINGAKK